MVWSSYLAFNADKRVQLRDEAELDFTFILHVHFPKEKKNHVLKHILSTFSPPKQSALTLEYFKFYQYYVKTF